MQQVAPTAEPHGLPTPPTSPSEQDRAAIRRALLAWTDDAHVAEDLAQETLVEAWRSARRPDDPTEQRRWLFGVARNVLLRWRREQARYARFHLPASEEHLALAAAEVDLEAELDESDLIDLLDAALASLPRASRQALLLRYVDELPHAQIARRLGLTEGALEGRLHRGKLALRRHLVTEQLEQAASLGLLQEGDEWQKTRIWCSVCGERQLEAKWGPQTFLRVDCPSCAMLNGWRSVVIEGFVSPPNAREHSDLKWRSFKPAINRTMRQLHVHTGQGILFGPACPICSERTIVHRFDETWWDYPEVWIVCPSCHYPLTYSFIPGSTQAHPSIWGFTNEQKRVRLLPRLTVEHQGRQTLVMAWESLTSGEVVEALRDHETLVYRGIFRNGRRIEADQLG